MTILEGYKLNEKQLLFAEEYLTNRYNATKAYKKAYNENATNGVAKSYGSKLLKDAEIQRYIKDRMNDLIIEKQLNTDRWLLEVATLAFDKGIDAEEGFGFNEKIKCLDLMQKVLIKQKEMDLRSKGIGEDKNVIITILGENELKD